jgi:hypothetical protein
MPDEHNNPQLSAFRAAIEAGEGSFQPQALKTEGLHFTTTQLAEMGLDLLSKLPIEPLTDVHPDVRFLGRVVETKHSELRAESHAALLRNRLAGAKWVLEQTEHFILHARGGTLESKEWRGVLMDVPLEKSELIDIAELPEGTIVADVPDAFFAEGSLPQGYRVVIQPGGLVWRQLMPMMVMPLATLMPTVRELVVLYGYPKIDPSKVRVFRR